jgi:cytochrome P450
MMEFMRRAWREHGDTFRMSLGGRTIVGLAHPDAIEHVLIKRRDNYIKGQTYDSIRVLTGQGLLTLEGDRWKQRRKLAQPAFHRERLLALTATMTEVARETIESWRSEYGSKPFDMHVAMMRLTLEIVGATLLGQRFGKDKTDASAHAYGQALELLSARSNAPVQLPLWAPTPSNRRLKAALASVETLVYGVIDNARANPEQAPLLLRMLLEAKDADTGESLSTRELRDEVVTLILAGHETTALLLSWGFTLLGKEPDAVRRMRTEIQEVCGDRPPAPEDLQKLTYTGWTVDEMLRLRAPVWAVARDVVAADEIAGFPVHPGEMVMPLVFLTHRHPAFWQDPERFDPERFSPARKEGRHHGAYLPFSSGPRVCIGNMFTLIEAKIILATLLQRADVELLRFGDIPEVAGMTMRPKDPIDVRLRWR